MRRLSPVIAVFACLVFGVFTPSHAGEWEPGDIVVAIGGGTYLVFHNFGTAASPNWIVEDTITDPEGAGLTAGCASDATYHLLTTNFAATGLSTGAVNRWTMNADPPSAHTSILTLPNSPANKPVFPGGTSNPSSVVVDADGNLYIGMAGGKGLIVEYTILNGVLGSPTTLPINTNKVNGRTPFIDLSPDGQTVYFTNGSGSISSFPVSSKNISTFPGTVSGAKFFGFRILPGAVAGSGAPFLIVAAQSAIYEFDGTGKLLNTYTVTGETNFQFITLDPNGTSFWAGNPSTNNFYRLNIVSGAQEFKVSNTTGTLSGLCAYGDFHAAQAQPMAASPSGLTSLDQNNSVQFHSPFNNDSSTTLKLTFTPATQSSLNGYSVSAIVTAIEPSAGFSDTNLTSLGGTLPTANALACTPNGQVVDANGVAQCLVWIVVDNVDPRTLTASLPYSAVGFAFQQLSGADGNTRLIRNGNTDITWLVSNLDPAGSPIRKSGYSLHQIDPAETPLVFCGYTSPVPKGIANLGSGFPFKFNAATSQTNCNNGVFTTKLTSPFGAPFLLVWQLPSSSQAGTTTGSQVPNVAVSGNANQPPVYRSTGSGFILNLKTSNLTAGACYAATTYANEIPASSIEFCVQ